MTNYVIAASCLLFVCLSIAGYVLYAQAVTRRRTEAAFWEQVFPERPAADLYDWAVELPELIAHPGPVERHLDRLPDHGLTHLDEGDR